MTIVDGEGAGSVVETHATPIESGRSAVIEATLATSGRWQFWIVVRVLAKVLRPLMRRAAWRLWGDDAAYAERRYDLRMGKATTATGNSPGVHGISSSPHALRDPSKGAFSG